MFEITINCQYEGGDVPDNINPKMIALRKKLKEIKDNDYSDFFSYLKYYFFFSGEFHKFDGENGFDKITFHKARNYIKTEVVVHEDISMSDEKTINEFLHNTIISSVEEIIKMSVKKKLPVDSQLLDDIKTLLNK